MPLYKKKDKKMNLPYQIGQSQAGPNKSKQNSMPIAIKFQNKNIKKRALKVQQMWG